jgi:hypothetical protein
MNALHQYCLSSSSVIAAKLVGQEISHAGLLLTHKSMGRQPVPEQQVQHCTNAGRPYHAEPKAQAAAFQYGCNQCKFNAYRIIELTMSS